MRRTKLVSLIFASVTLLASTAFGQVERVVVRVDGLA